MSYNIDSFKVKKLSNFAIPDTSEIPDDLLPEGFSITETPFEDECYVSDIALAGDWSGHFFHDYFLGMLERSTGMMLALVIWEGGDTVEMIMVEDGVVTRAFDCDKPESNDFSKMKAFESK